MFALAAACASAASNLRQPPGGTDASFDSKSFLVGDQRRLLLCGGLHYFRIPPEEWRDRLLQTRLAGFNMVETPVPWNLHQPARDADLRLDGPADLGRFLDLCHEMKLLALVRIGPYVNATVTSGGLPAWLGEDPKLLVRCADDRFLQAVRQYWAKLLPVVVSRQVPRGPVALIQIEDHYQGPDARYLGRLYEEVKDAGLRVPVVLSDLNPVKDFQRAEVPDTAFYATTELMPAGPLAWGERYRPFLGFGDILAEGIAKGIDGYNHSMWAAGTNLALLPASSFPTRYEASSCGLLEAGGPSSIFPEVRRANWFAQAFEGVLTQASAIEPPPFFRDARASGLVTHCRGSEAAALLFVKCRYGTSELVLPNFAPGVATALPLTADAFRHIVGDFPLTPKTTLSVSTAQVLSIQPFPDKRVLVVYAPAGSEAVMLFRTAKQPALRAGGEACTWNEKEQQLTLRWKCAAKGERKDFLFEADAAIHVIAIEEGLVAQTWVLPGAGILIGASRVGEWTPGEPTKVELRLPTRRVRQALTFYPCAPLHGVAPATGLSDIKCDDAAGRIDCLLDVDIMEPLTVFLRKWEMADALAETAPGFDDAAWRETLRPEPLGEGHHGWYRCRFQAARAATRKLVIENLADSVTVFLNGQYVGQSPTKRPQDGPRSFPSPAHFELSVKAGENVLAILAKNWGCYRDTSAYGVPLNASSGWGILGGVTLDGQPMGRWRQHEGLDPQGRSLNWTPISPKPETRNAKLETAPAPLRWFRTTFSPRKQPAHLAARLQLKGASYGVLWCNGQYAGLYSQGGSEAGEGYCLPTPWLRPQNEIVLLEEGGQQPAEGEVRFDRIETYVPLTLEFTAQPSAAPAPKARPRPAPKGKAK